MPKNFGKLVLQTSLKICIALKYGTDTSA